MSALFIFRLSILQARSNSHILFSTCVNNVSKLVTSQRIEDDLSLTRGGLLLFALLVGGDYDLGIEGCGSGIAHGLAKCGFGDTLMNALSSLSGTCLRKFLDLWRKQMREELRTNAAGILGRCYRAVAAKIPDSFPNLSVARLYHSPLTSWSESESAGPVPDRTVWKPREPDIERIATFCTERFAWDPEKLFTKFRSTLWPGVAFQILCSVNLPFFLSFIHLAKFIPIIAL